MSRTLSEHESKRLLGTYGVPLVPDRVVSSPVAAGEAAVELGLPVAVKLTGDAIAHKTDRGLVRLGVDSPAAVEAAATAILAAARPEDGHVAILVARMANGARELIAGVHTDEQFGRCLMVGVGGVAAEALGDVVFRLVPIEAVDAVEMLDDLRSQALLGPFRGEPALDREATADALLGLSRLAEEHPEFIAVDVNPLVVVDGRPVAVDALVEVAS